MVRGFSVTEGDLQDFRDLLRLFLNITLQNSTRKEKDPEVLYQKVQTSVDDYLYLEEPFVVTEAMFAATGQKSGVVLVSEDHFEWYMQYATIAIPTLPEEPGFQEPNSQFLSTSEANNVLTVARGTQSKLRRALEAAAEYEEDKAPAATKGFVN